MYCHFQYGCYSVEIKESVENTIKFLIETIKSMQTPSYYKELENNLTNEMILKYFNTTEIDNYYFIILMVCGRVPNVSGMEYFQKTVYKLDFFQYNVYDGIMLSVLSLDHEISVLNPIAICYFNSSDKNPFAKN